MGTRFACLSCGGPCKGLDVGFLSLDNPHLRDLAHPKAPLTSAIPIVDRRKNIHQIILDKEVVYSLRLPATQGSWSLFQRLEKFFWPELGTPECRTWAEYDIARGVKFDWIDNTHQLNGSLSAIYHPKTRDGAIFEVKLHGTDDNKPREYHYYIMPLTVQCYRAVFHPETLLEQEWDSVFARSRASRYSLINQTLRLHKTIPAATGCEFKLAEQHAIVQLFLDTKQRYLAQAVAHVAKAFCAGSEPETTNNWAVVEFLLKRKSLCRMPSRYDPTWTPEKILQEKTNLQDYLRSRFQDCDSFPTETLEALTYRMHCYNHRNAIPIDYELWMTRREANFSLHRYADVLRPTIESVELSPARLLDSCRAVQRGRATDEENKTVQIIYDKCYEIPGLLPKPSSLLEVAKWFTTRLECKAKDPGWQWLYSNVCTRQLTQPSAQLQLQLQLQAQLALTPVFVPLSRPDHRNLTSEKGADLPTALVQSFADKFSYWENKGVDATERIARQSNPKRHLMPARVSAQARLLCLHIEGLRGSGRRAKFERLDSRWLKVRDALNMDESVSSPPLFFFADVEAVDNGNPILFSASFLRCDAPSVDIDCRITREKPSQTCSLKRLDLTVDHGTPIFQAFQGAPISRKESLEGLYKWAAKQYNVARADMPTWGLKEADIADKLRDIGFNETSRTSNLLITWVIIEKNGWDRRVLATLQGTKDILPDALSPCTLLSPLGWSHKTALQVVFRAVALSEKDEERRAYYEKLLLNHHLPWVDNEMARISTKELLKLYE
ncbi:hypothetical protein EV127DRAFT_420633 [Xylaria flabelliformis]|nr:hypothetical protein EV127DRAFT_420633 [Xylaria flabelliformis]